MVAEWRQTVYVPGWVCRAVIYTNDQERQNKDEKDGERQTERTFRKPATNITRQALKWNRQGTRKRGRSKNSWRRGVQAEMSGNGLNWEVPERTANNQTRRRTFVDGLWSLEEQRV
ncbi:hypothetical protein PAMP_018984 [Pampus punctatissimus]